MGWRGVLAKRTPPIKAAAKRRSQAEVRVTSGAATRSSRSNRGAAHSAASLRIRWAGVQPVKRWEEWRAAQTDHGRSRAVLIWPLLQCRALR